VRWAGNPVKQLVGEFVEKLVGKQLVGKQLVGKLVENSREFAERRVRIAPLLDQKNVIEAWLRFVARPEPGGLCERDDTPAFAFGPDNACPAASEWSRRPEPIVAPGTSRLLCGCRQAETPTWAPRPATPTGAS